MDQDYDYSFKIILIGDSGVGKSSIVNVYCDENFSDSLQSTIGVDFKIKTVDVNNKKIKLQIWDTAGQERFRNIVTSYYRGSHGIFIVYDVNDKTTFDNIFGWIREVERNCGSIIKSDTNSYESINKKMCIIGNKTDLPRVVSYEEAKLFADDIGADYIEMSAKKGNGLNMAFVNMARSLYTSKTPVIANTSNNHNNGKIVIT